MSLPNISQYSQSSIYATRPSKPGGPETAKANDVSFMAKDDFTEQKKVGMDRILEKVESDENFAKEMVDVYRKTPDRPIFNLEQALSSPGGLPYIQDINRQFNIEAQKVSAQREELYNSLTAQNYSNADIFKALMEFNNSLPGDYKQAAGIVKSTLNHKASGRK